MKNYYVSLFLVLVKILFPIHILYRVGCVKVSDSTCIEELFECVLIKVDPTCFGYSKIKVLRDQIVLIFRKVGPYLVLNKDFHF